MRAFFLLFALACFASGYTYSCSDPNVFCVCLGCLYTTIPTAYTACAVTEGRKDCVIRISSDNNPYVGSIFISTSMNETTPGLFTTYPGETVITTGNVWRFMSNHWRIGTDDGRIIMHPTSGGTTGAVTLTSNGRRDLQVGPGVEIDCGNSTNVNGLYILIDDFVEGFVVDDVTFTASGTGSFDYMFLGALMSGTAVMTPPVYHPYRLTVRNSKFLSVGGIDLHRLSDFLIETSYFVTPASTYGIEAKGCPRGLIQNNIMEDSGVAPWAHVMIRSSQSPDSRYRSHDIMIQQNTISCTVQPTMSALRFNGGFPTSGTDPYDIIVRNNLVLGSCGARVMSQFNAVGGCLDDAGSVLGCNRAAGSTSWWSSSSWTNNVSNCADSGLNVAVDIQTGTKPTPHFIPTQNYVGEAIGAGTRDYLGVRKAWLSPTMGALEYMADVKECFGVLSTSDDVCGGDGICTSNDTCDCNVYAGDNCDDFLCEDGLLNYGMLSCSDHGNCTLSNPECICDAGTNWNDFGGYCDDFQCADNNWFYAGSPAPACGGLPGGCTYDDATCACGFNWEDRFGTCDDYKCEDGEWDGDGNTCSNHGDCTAVDDTCVCDVGTAWGNEGTGFCNDYRCEDGFWQLGQPTLACNGHGTCLAADGLCVCSDNWVDNAAACDDVVCDDGLWLVADSATVCNAHGVCTGTDSACVCNTGTGWGGTNCNECDSHWTGADCDECDSHWTGADCDSCSPGFTGTNCLSTSIPFTGPFGYVEGAIVGSVSLVVVVLVLIVVGIVVICCCCKAKARRGGAHGNAPLQDKPVVDIADPPNSKPKSEPKEESSSSSSSSE